MYKKWKALNIEPDYSQSQVLPKPDNNWSPMEFCILSILQDKVILTHKGKTKQIAVHISHDMHSYKTEHTVHGM